MPKLKTKSACKRRFRVTGTGKIKTKRSNKRHCMSKRKKRQIRTNRKTGYMFKGDARFVKKVFLRITRKLKKKKKKK